jgi:glycosyltransferase involved in cell wall biosynthesis
LDACLVFLASVDIIVVPSILNEPFGRVAIEPLPYGVPVIIARAGGLPESIEDGVSGLIFAPGNDELLAGLLSVLANDKARLQSLSKGAVERSRRFDFGVFARDMERVVKEVVRDFGRHDLRSGQADSLKQTARLPRP